MSSLLSTWNTGILQMTQLKWTRRDLGLYKKNITQCLWVLFDCFLIKVETSARFWHMKNGIPQDNSTGMHGDSKQMDPVRGYNSTFEGSWSWLGYSRHPVWSAVLIWRDARMRNVVVSGGQLWHLEPEAWQISCTRHRLYLGIWLNLAKYRQLIEYDSAELHYQTPQPRNTPSSN